MSEKYWVKSNVVTSKQLDLHIHGGIECYEDYDGLVKEISSASENDSVIVHLNCPGGACSVGFWLIDHVISMPCPVQMVVHYPTYSMGAIMALCGDNLEIAPDAFLMFHDYSGGSEGKGEEMHQHGTHYRRFFKERFSRLCQPFLTKKEVDRMFKGEDIYIQWDDPTLPARIARHFK